MDKRIILLVEDNPDDIELTLDALAESNIVNEIVVAKDGVEALDYIFATGQYSGRDINDFPAVVMLDLELPKVDGLEVLECIRSDERTKVIPVVILTSSNEQEDILKGYKLGCNSYIRKPVDSDQFSVAIKQLELYWLVLNEPPLKGGN